MLIIAFHGFFIAFYTTLVISMCKGIKKIDTPHYLFAKKTRIIIFLCFFVVYVEIYGEISDFDCNSTIDECIIC